MLDLLATAGPGRGRWSVALVRAHAVATGEPGALALLQTFEAELGAATGLTPPRWPSRLRPAHPLAQLVTPALDPSQLLMLGAGQSSRTAADEGAVAVLLDAAFGAREESPHTAELRARVCSLAIPSGARERWRAGFGLMPPDAVVPGEHLGAMRLLQAAFADDGSVRAVDPTVSAPMRPESALDVLLSGLAVRAALRRTRILQDLDTTVVERRAA